MKGISFSAIGSVAYKEFLHIARDWRILLLLISFPPVFTLVIGTRLRSDRWRTWR